MIRRLIVVLVGLYIAGFIVFVASLPKTPRVPKYVQGVVVLTGGDTRLDAAVALFERGVGERLLISGVHPQITKDELKKLSGGGKRFECCADLGYAAEDTRGNAEEAAAWARFHHYHSLLVVTARYHMPRSLAEFRAAMPDVKVVPYPVDPESIHLDGWWHNPRALRVLGAEYTKYLAVALLTSFGVKPNFDHNARRAESGSAS
ncbi:MAG: YdcF family protein [Alphaproteobacteria bacterium]|nr:YdcF family protein [Alphaproteobacteria bacterium]